MVRVFRDEIPEEIRNISVGEDEMEALGDRTRIKIMRLLSAKAHYPAELAEQLDIPEQKLYYHFGKLREAGLVEKVGEEKKSGGTASYYRSVADGILLDLGGEGRKTFLPPENGDVRRFLSPLLSEGRLEGKLVAGSPQEHGEDQVKALDGHRVGEIGAKLGNYGDSGGIESVIDTEVIRESGFSSNLVLLGGVLTNTVTKRFNEHLPASFNTESFPYHSIETPGESYSDGSIGVIEKITNPEKIDRSVFVVGGVRHRGTVAAVKAFKNLEDIVEDYEGGKFYRIVKGLDMDGDGEIDSFEVVE